MTRRSNTHRAAASRWPGVNAFIDRHGWRAYAVPVLIVMTVVAFFQSSPVVRRQAVAETTVTVTMPTALPKAKAKAAVHYPTQKLWVETDSTACLHNTHAKFVLVSISQQHAWMCQGQQQVNSTAVTTGATKLDDATPTGSWTVQGEARNTYLTGKDYRDFVKFWIPFDGDIGFHDASWQTMPFGAAGYRTQGSHGCVHLPLTVIQWLYSWAQVGSTVVTVRA